MRFSKGLYPHLTKDRWGQIRFGNDLKDDAKIMLLRLFYEVASNAPLYFVSQVFTREAVSNLGKIGLERTLISDGKKFSYIGNSNHYFGIIGKITCVVNKGVLVYYAFSEDTSFVNAKSDVTVSSYMLNTATSTLSTRKERAEATLSIPISIFTFKHFAELKAKQLPPKGKLKDFHCRYKSDLNIPINLLTENWYTESCQNHPFVVRGHWRMQACGEGLSERKLIYVNPFMKKGYTKGTYKDN